MTTARMGLRGTLEGALRLPRRLAAGVRDRLDGLRHDGRRERAGARLAAIQPSTVLFLCFGNVCRSPYGERWWCRRGADVDACSAGFYGPGRHPPDVALAVARERGVEHSDHVSQSVTDELLESADAVFVFDRFHLRLLWEHGGVSRERVFWLGDFDPRWSGKRAIADPWGATEEEFDRTFARIERCVDQALGALETVTTAGSGTTPPTP